MFKAIGHQLIRSIVVVMTIIPMTYVAPPSSKVNQDAHLWQRPAPLSEPLLQIIDVSVSPDPIVGQVTRLHVEVMSTEDEPDATIFVDLPEGVKVVEGDLNWKGSLTANQPQTLEVSICVLYEGDWRLWIETYSMLAEDSSYEDAETLHIQSTTESARVILGADYTITQPPGGFNMPTPLPVTVSPECSGQVG
jgi:hypothetical protein